MEHPDAPPGKGRKYARRERERRWLLARVPDESPQAVTAIHDRYILGTRLRLRRAEETGPGGQRIVFRLTQKIPAATGGPGLITTIYLGEDEHAALCVLPARELRKRRLSIPPFGVDVFEGTLTDLVLAEAEFDSDEEMSRAMSPPGAIAEVTHDERFTGGNFVRLARAGLEELLSSMR